MGPHLTLLHRPSALSDAAKSFAPVSNDIETHLTNLKDIVEWLDSYKPCLDSIRLALSSPSNTELQSKAFEELRPNVLKVQDFYKKVILLGEFVPLLLASLAAEGRIDNDPYLTRQFLQLLQLMCKADTKKMMSPGIQNDFSFYRRSVGKFQDQAPVSETSANQISMWIAEATPVVSQVATQLKAGVRKDPTMVLVLAKLANMSAWVVYKDHDMTKSQKEELVVAMVESIIILDRAAPRGAFHKDSGVMMKKCLRVMTSPACAELENVQGLKNSMKYSTLHFNDASTPSFVADILE